ncbi:MAG TPA: FAD-linked oxidase C-terminal domain-containing protein [Terriglobales bacterium]|nr:FAD-linked oxidase C-terminal domain-containing protein [Terriglobales bacterium]
MLDSTVVKRLRKIVGDDGVLWRPEDVLLYEYDAGLSKGTPGAVVLPRTSEQVSQVVRLAHETGVSLVARGAGTGLSGGSISRDGGIVIGFSRMKRILEIDLANQRAIVQPGVVNTDLSAAVAAHGFYFAPDPSSQRAATVGGHVAENSGGPHTLAYGVTTNHVTGLEVVLWDGRIAHFGGKTADVPGYDLTGFFVGSEGTVGIVTAVTVKLTRLPEAVATLLAIYNSMDDAAQTVVAITREGITPAALELLDGWTLRIVEDFVHAGYPKDSGAVLLIELEGLREAVEEQAEAVRQVCVAQNARQVRRAANQQERELLWKGRKNAFGAIGRISPSYYTQDGVVPRTKIPETLQRIAEIAEKYNLTIGNIFHAGDGNLHPAILFDLRDEDQVRRTHHAGAEIIKYCCDVGGTITGEHGVGMEKNELMPFLFSDQDISVMSRLRDAFNPNSIFNPQKLLPTPRTCREGTFTNALLHADDPAKGPVA